MNEEAKIREGMESMHAADDLYDQVMARAEGSRRRRRGHALPVAAAVGLGLAGTLATVGIAGAIVTADPLFFVHAWSDHGEDGSSEWDVYGGVNDDKYLYSVTRSYEGVGAEEASVDMASAVEGVGLSCELVGYTLTIYSMVVDSNCCGAATYTLANPDGVGYDPSYGAPGELVLNADTGSSSDDGLSVLQMLLPHDDGFGFADTCVMFDRDASSATEVHGTIYFGSFGELDALLAGVSWQLAGHTGEWDSMVYIDSTTEEFKPSRVVEAKAYEDEGGARAYLSPMSLSIDVNSSERDEFICDRVALRLADGSEHVVREGGEETTLNTYFSYLGKREGRDVITMVFTGLVDVSQVTGVTVSGDRDGNTETYEFS